jgi:cyclopropane fatty-acyl-phospholipid synthase-like methyltransferase
MTNPTDETDPPDAPKGPFRLSMRDRLVAWWEGYDLSPLRAREKAEAEEAASQAATDAAPAPPPGTTGRLDRFGKPLWTATRIQVAEKMWGEGLTTPGGQEYMESLVKPLGLNKTMSVLDMSAGLGGLTRAIHRVYGAWVTGVEANPMLAQHGMEYSKKAHLKKQAPISHYDPNAFNIDRRYDAIFAKETLFTVADKGALFRKINDAIKPGGQLLLIDYVLTSPDMLPSLRAWSDVEPEEPFPWSIDEARETLKRLGFDVRVAEDGTARQISSIASALSILQKHLQSHELDAETRTAVTTEVGLWAKRAEALTKGLKLYRFHALKPG